MRRIASAAALMALVALGAVAAWGFAAGFVAAKEPAGKEAGAKDVAADPMPGTDDASRRHVDVLTWEGAIQPITFEVISHAVDRAEKERREVLVIRLDTPGGLDTSMRDIIKRILISEVPVVVYVAPSGGRAASAGTFIAMAAHVAAMSPGTSIGAATPVQVGGGDVSKDMARKVKNDAVSYIRSLASQRGRNADWAEKAVREGGSLGETDAVRLHVVDLIARDVDELLASIDGRRVTVGGETRRLRTANAERHEIAPTWRQQLLSRIVDPNVAYILFILGFYGLLFELSNPGAILPGVVGGICLLLAFLAFQALPINLTGLLLIVFAMVLFAVDVKVQSNGILAAGGILALILGSMILLGEGSGMARISISVIATTVIATVVFFLFIVRAGYVALRRRAVTGALGLLGERGTALTALEPAGQVFVHGEYWNAEAEEPIAKGASVVVEQVEGLLLRVKKA